MTPNFLTPLDLEYLDGRNWRLITEFDYTTNVGKLGTLHIPAGTLTDFASVPKFLWNIFPPTGQYGKAAVLHDYLYRTPGLATRKEADDVFYEGMKVLGVGWRTRWSLYTAVRLFGGVAYKAGLQ